MNYFRRIKQMLLKRLLSALEAENLIDLTPGSKVHKSARFRGVRMSGLINVAENCRISDGVSISGGAEIAIGRYTSINGPNTDIFALVNKVSIGSFTSIARSVSIQEFNHRIKTPSTYFMNKNIFRGDRISDVESKGGITIGNDVWIGAHSIVLGGAVIGNGAIIGANSVVTGVVPDYAIAVGSPARVVGFRFSEAKIAELLSMAWWDWDISRIMQQKEFFNTPITEK